MCFPYNPYYQVRMLCLIKTYKMCQGTKSQKSQSLDHLWKPWEIGFLQKYFFVRKFASSPCFVCMSLHFNTVIECKRRGFNHDESEKVCRTDFLQNFFCRALLLLNFLQFCSVSWDCIFWSGKWKERGWCNIWSSVEGFPSHG